MPPTDPEFDALLALSARLGRDRLVTQGAGGNTSIKLGDTMWVKASGTWLAEAGERDIFTPVRHAALNAAVAANDARAETAVDFVDREQEPAALRPSIETTLHALMPQPVVLHVHCVDTIATAMLAGRASVLEARLAGLKHALAPYARPGLPLTRAVAAAIGPETNVVVFGNHGLLVAAETVSEAEHLLAEVRTRLARPARAPRSPNLAGLAALSAESGYRPAADEAAHQVALDPDSLAIARKGSAYPDHVIFLGPGIVELPAGDQPEAFVAGLDRPRPPALIVPGFGVLIDAAAGKGVEPMLGCLGDVTARLSPADDILTLAPDEEAELLGWEAEKYRQALAKARQA
jgi:rhamnose utilization protein RhaD (predicted bifunctional aldolase and dehydrogenase)